MLIWTDDINQRIILLCFPQVPFRFICASIAGCVHNYPYHRLLSVIFETRTLCVRHTLFYVYVECGYRKLSYAHIINKRLPRKAPILIVEESVQNKTTIMNQYSMQELQAKKRRLQHKSQITLDKLRGTQNLIKEGRLFLVVLPFNSKEIEQKMRILFQDQADLLQRLNRFRKQIKRIEERMDILKQERLGICSDELRLNTNDSRINPRDSRCTICSRDSEIGVRESMETGTVNSPARRRFPIVDTLRKRSRNFIGGVRQNLMRVGDSRR